MGLLINGEWHDQWYEAKKKAKGEFVREESQFRNWITPDGQPGPSGVGGFLAESGRYHLYVSYACPWAHRTLIFRALKGLTDHITLSVVQPEMLERGWEFIPTHPLYRDPVNFCRCLYEIYLLADPFHTGRASVPVLWDKKEHTIVNNESSEIIRMFNSAFNAITGNTLDFYPEPLRPEIDKINQFVYDNINNGVYRCGFATSQNAYNKAFDVLFNALDTIEQRLAKQQPYLVGDLITEADWRLFTTLLRFDVVYYGHFKCNLRRIADYRHLSHYLKELYHIPSVAQTVNFEHIKTHYYYSQITINPTQIVPKGPIIDLSL
ncbi:MAG: glutathione S-transferase family protein [Candidatus Berkiellales bacterium]